VGLTSFPLSRVLLFLWLGSHRGFLAFLLGLLFQCLSLEECPNQFFLVDKLLGQLHELGQGNLLDVLLPNLAINGPSTLTPCIKALSIVLSSGLSTSSFSLLKRSIKSFRVSSFPWRRVNKQVTLFFLFSVLQGTVLGTSVPTP
jgi:hypothetical protein